MNKGIVLLSIILSLVMVGCSTSKNQTKQEAGNTQENTNKQEILEKAECYVIKDNGDFSYSYYITDKEGKILLEDDNCMKQPHIKQVNDEIVGVTIQGGTGQSTNWAKYCNVQTGRVSEAFRYVLGEQDEYIIFADRKEETCFVIVQNIFDKSAYYAEYELENVSPVAADFITGFDVTDNGEIMITYPTGDSYEEKELTIKIE